MLNMIQIDKTTNILALSSRNISKYELLTSADILPEKRNLEKAATIKRFECSQLRSELKKQNNIAKDLYTFFKDQINVNNNNT